jgi:hypothetical protein
VEGLRLAPQTGGSVRGRLRMESSGAARLDPSQMFLLLRRADFRRQCNAGLVSEIRGCGWRCG